MTLAARVAGFAGVGFILFGAGLLAMLHQRLGLGYAKDLAALSALQERLPTTLFAAGMISVTVVGGMGLFLSLCWTHAVSGPLVRVRRYLQELATNQPIEEVRFRKTDQLHRLADAFEHLIAARSRRRAAWDTSLERAERLLQDCEHWSARHPDDPSGLRQPLRDLHDVYEQMHQLFQGDASGYDR
ncbi:MAG: hypothetical protein HY352_01140 [Candidatus Omnitrophica bacterium]|nr:hypothetical protein [Candidatus Omnitrophota bacterium]